MEVDVVILNHLDRSTVRTSDFKSENRGSIPRRGVFIFFNIFTHYIPTKSNITDVISIFVHFNLLGMNNNEIFIFLTKKS
jgi:hypothetical protein